MKNLKADEYTTNVFNYINPAFENISDEVNLHDVKHTKTNVFYKEYEKAIKLARIILQRFGYNISNIKNADKITTPPFWIDMSKLFELYVYAKLKEQYKNEVHFQFSGKGTYLDFLITKKGEEQIIDTKYKPKYKADYDLDDIRQLSGYARDENVLYKLGFKDSITQSNTVVKCLVIYPDNLANKDLDKTKEHKIEGFVKFHKQPIGLPLLNITN
jgi:5-methylcytosine-specific restriction enzyme subunit McrC